MGACISKQAQVREAMDEHAPAADQDAPRAAQAPAHEGGEGGAAASQRPAHRPNFPERTPMMVMRYVDFVQQGGIPRSDVAKRKGLLVTFDETEHIAVFVSHTWWLRPKDATSHDTGQPDYQEGDKANLKYRTTVRGVERLIEERGLDRSKVVLWIDWFSIEQDDRALKLAGVESLIGYATRCEYMLIPVEVEERIEELGGCASFDPGSLPAYGPRAWCRCEWFIFMLWAEMEGAEEVQLLRGQPPGGARPVQERDAVWRRQPGE